jgi:hypothetical protein
MKKRIQPRSRFAVNVPYYIIDFGMSTINPTARKASGHVGQDGTVPEFKTNEPYDPFKLDIYQVGNIIRREFLSVRRNLYLGAKFECNLYQRYVGLDVLAPLAGQ